jgi:nitrite reductase/ring-hydroxylating ferredoxin subunit
MPPWDDGARFVTVARAADLAPGQGRQVTIDRSWVALFNVEGEFHAVDGTCLHRGGPLAEGALSGCIIACPWHGWEYNVRTGALLQDPRVGVTCHETRVVEGDVQVRLSPSGPGTLAPDHG